MNEYLVSVNGLDHTVRLSDEAAARLGAKPVGKAAKGRKKRAPKNKAVKAAANKAVEPEPEEPEQVGDEKE